MLWGAYYLLVTYVRCQASGFSKGVLEIPEDEKRFQKMKRDKGENKKPGFFFFFLSFPQLLYGAVKTREVSQRAASAAYISTTGATVTIGQ